MTYYGGNELAAAFRTVRQNTIQIAEEIPEASYSVKAAEASRTIAETLVHIAFVSRFQLHVHESRMDSLMKINFPEYMQLVTADESKPRNKAAIIELLKTERDRFTSFLESLSESVLAEPVGMPPGAEPATKSRFEMLLSAKEHEMHHRGQLMIVQRMIGLTPHLTRQRQEMAARAQAAHAAR